MKLGRLWLFLSILIIPSEERINTDLVEKYLISERNVRSVVMLLCSEKDLTNMGRKLNKANVYFVNNFIGKDEFNATNLFSRFFYASCGVVVDCECPGVEDILQESSNYRYFNLTYTWMLFGSPGDTFDNFLDPFPNIEMSSDLVYIQTERNSSKVNLVDVYSLGRHRGSSLLGVPFAEFDTVKSELQIHVNLWPKFRTSQRSNFKGFTLKAVVPIDRDNVTKADVDPLLKLPGKTLGIATFVKYQSHLNYYIQEMFNFTMNYRVTRAWAGHLPSGYRLGMLGVMARGEADISMSAIFAWRNRFDEYDYVHRSYVFQPGFIYRIGSESSDSDASLMAPFNPDVWTSLMITIVIILLVGILVRCTFLLNKLYFSGSSARDFVDLFAALCQQGIDPVPRNLVQRIIIFMLLFLAFFLYNYYTSSVVGVLLSTPVKGPSTPEEIIASSYKLSFDDVGYHKILFKEKKTLLAVKMYEKLSKQKRTPKDLPMYTGIFSAVPYIKSGLWAYHCELTEAYSAIAQSLDAGEICNLRIVTGLMQTSELEAILPKQSQYRELMRIGFMHLREVGFVKRALKIYRIEKPECLSGISVFAVGFKAVSAAFYVLIAGMCLSLTFLAVEILSEKYSSRKKAKMQFSHSRKQFRMRIQRK